MWHLGCPPTPAAPYFCTATPLPQHDSIVVGVACNDGIVLAAERQAGSPLMLASSVSKLREVDSHCGATFAGLTPDARTLVDRARIEAASHRFSYDEPAPVKSLARAVCDLAISFGEADDEENGRGKRRGPRMARPFGVSILLGAAPPPDAPGAKPGRSAPLPSLWCCDPSGTMFQYRAHAIGGGAEGARSLLEEKHAPGMSLEDAAALAVLAVKNSMRGAATTDSVEVATITPRDGYRIAPVTEVARWIEVAAEEAAADGAGGGGADH